LHETGGKKEGTEYPGGQHERLEADETVAQAEEGVELERNEGDRHGGGQCTEWQT
jgi:hypothetical protein